MKLNEIVKQYGEQDGNIYRIWLDLNGVCNLDGHTDVMCAHLGEDGILTFQVNTPDDQSTIFVYPEELPKEALEEATSQVLEYAENQNDKTGEKLVVGDKVFWHDEAGYNEDGSMIIFTIEQWDGLGYFNLANEGEENPERWAFHSELQLV